jgi:hypothetical protein
VVPDYEDYFNKMKLVTVIHLPDFLFKLRAGVSLPAVYLIKKNSE